MDEEWGFDGYVLSDLGAISMMYDTHHTAATPQDAMRQYLTAGGNMQVRLFKSHHQFYDFSHDSWQNGIINLVQSGQLPEAVVDKRVADVLRVKNYLGLFDNPFTDPSLVSHNVNSAKHKALALQAAREAITLLQNDGTLPLKESISSIAIIGPSCDTPRHGTIFENQSNTSLPVHLAENPEAFTFFASGP